MEYIVSKKQSQFGLLVVVTDSDIVGKKFEEGRLQLDLTKKFYRGEEKNKEEVKGDSLRLDAGFNDRELVRRIAELEMLPYVYPKKSNDINGSDPWREMYLEFFYDVIQWLSEYYLRVHSESFHSAFKRVYGILTKTRNHSKFVQVIARIILHNRARLSYFNRIKE